MSEHMLINLSWACQLACPYCLLPHIRIDRAAPEHSWADWAVALRDHSQPGALFDFAGGDPLLFDGLALLLKVLAESGRRWAITTNAISKEGTDDLLRVRPPGGVLINVSDHPGRYECEDNIRRLREVYPVVFNRVDHPQAGHRHPDIASIIPYQSWREGTERDGIRRWCDSGRRHWVADPGGNVFRCNPAMATAQEPIGNLFKRTLELPEPCICEEGCSTCYTAVGPSAWCVDMREVA